MVHILKETSVLIKNARQIIVAASSWSQSLEFLVSTYIKEPHIVTACAIEAAVRLGVEVVGACTLNFYMSHDIIIILHL